MDEFDEFLTELRRRVAIAEVKHPLFADGIYQGAGCISAEHGEFWNAVTKNEGEKRIRRITGYLVGTLDRFNDAKRAEEADRVKHGVANGR